MIKCLTVRLEVGHKKWGKFKLTTIIHLTTDFKHKFGMYICGAFYRRDFTLL